MEIYFKPFAPADLLHDLFNRFSKPCELKGLELILQTPPKSATLVVRSDQELLGKILFHLTDNAVKFTRQGKITVGFRVGETALEFYVKDTGIGIDARDQELVFEHFVQADPMSSRANEGSGLGLSIAKGLVELLGGRIRMESVKGEGTAVYFTLPADPSYTDGKANREWIVETGHKPLILIAEDVESNSLLISQHLQKAGIDFLVVTDGQQAVEACRLHPLITLVLMDIKIPVMNGYEATREIKTFAPTLPVIALTAYAQSGDKKKALDAGCDDYLTKPVSKELLMDKIKKFQVWVI